MLKKIIAFTVLATMVHPICAEAEDPRYQRIVELLESDNYQQGHRLLHDALADDTADTRIHLLYATGLSQQKYGFTRDIQLAVRVWEAAAAKGDVDAMVELGTLYSFGYQIPRDCDAGIGFFEQAVAHGDSDAAALLAAEYADGTCVPLNLPLAHELLEKPLSENNHVAQAVKARFYFFGDGVEMDHQKAVVLWEKSAEQYNCDALYNLGALYDNGVIFDTDLEKAFNYFAEGDSGDCTDSTVALGHMYNLGRHVPEDDAKAYEIYSKAWIKGDLEAQSEIAQLLLNGDGVEQDIAKGVALLTQAAERGHDRAQTHLASLYERGNYVEQSYQKAAKWYEKALEYDPFAQAGLAYLYEFGLGVERNLDKANALYLQAHAQGNTYAIESLSYWYIYGKYYSVDHRKALEILESGAKTTNDSVVALLATLLACSDDLSIRNVDKAEQLLKNHIKLRDDYYFYDIDIAMLNVLASQQQFEKAHKYQARISQIFNNPNSPFGLKLNHDAQKRYQQAVERVSENQICYF